MRHFYVSVWSVLPFEIWKLYCNNELSIWSGNVADVLQRMFVSLTVFVTGISKIDGKDN